MEELKYPFDAQYILKKRKAIRRALLEKTSGSAFLTKRIAILGGSTTHDLKDMLELFLLDVGIRPVFYESEYNQYWQDVMFDNPDLVTFQPDLIFIHTSSRNILRFPTVHSSRQAVEQLLEDTFHPYVQMWERIAEKYRCPIIQNNFEHPPFRLLGNADFSHYAGRLHFIDRLNAKLAAYADGHSNFYVNDINYMAACYGLQRWADPSAWHMYKYACAVQALPELAFNLSHIIKSIYGKNKKAFVLDLDNTLWGGVVGDDGADNIEIGQETPMAQIYSEFQSYLKAHKDLGVLLTVDSKNDEANAMAGLKRPDSVLKPDDFPVIMANWEPKDQNIRAIAAALNIGTESLVFVDDNPAERALVATRMPDVETPNIDDVTKFIPVLDRSGFFEVTALSADDLQRNDMYKANALRQEQAAAYTDYAEYLRSLEMKAEIAPFAPLYMARIAQLTNKSNQFNLTTRRSSQAEIESLAQSPECITLYGKLSDKFGDNGVVSVVYGHIDEQESDLFHIDCWLMSCRVLKRDMEYAMMDELIARCRARGIRHLRGYYFPTVKNGMVKDFYAGQGFDKIREDADGNTVWAFDIAPAYENRNKVIEVNE